MMAEMNQHVPHWPLPTTFPSLLPDQVHVWRASLEGSPAQIAYYQQLLSADELARAQRFIFERDQRRFIIARGTLRILLGSYLSIPYRDIVFGYTAHGKPYLSQPMAIDDLRFNLSHARELAVYAFTHRSRIGIDIEYQRPLPNVTQLAATVFSPHELAVFEALPDHLQLPAFYTCWTRKEAFIKAIGDGLSYPLDRFDVSLAPDEPAQLLRIWGKPHSHQCWTMDSCVPAKRYTGAIAVENMKTELSYMQFAHDL